MSGETPASTRATRVLPDAGAAAPMQMRNALLDVAAAPWLRNDGERPVTRAPP
jgi:hypothetical protein